MATAIEKLLEKMNGMSPYWSKTVELTVQEGEIVAVKCEGFTWKSDPKKEGGNG